MFVLDISGYSVFCRYLIFTITIVNVVHQMDYKCNIAVVRIGVLSFGACYYLFALIIKVNIYLLRLFMFVYHK